MNDNERIANVKDFIKALLANKNLMESFEKDPMLALKDQGILTQEEINFPGLNEYYKSIAKDMKANKLISKNMKVNESDITCIPCKFVTSNKLLMSIGLYDFKSEKGIAKFAKDFKISVAEVKQVLRETPESPTLFKLMDNLLNKICNC